MAYTGAELLAALNSPDTELDPLAIEFLYRDTVTMIAADPGVGKSTVATNIAVDLALGQPVFGRFAVPKPCRVFYLQLEGSFLESKKRLRLIRESQKVLPTTSWCVENLVWESWDAPLNVLKQDHVDMMVDYISGHGLFDLIIIDPIYMCVGGDLSKSDVANGFVRFSNTLRTSFNCGVLHLHHNHRPQKDTQHRVIEEEEAFYGSIYLKAHVDVSFSAKKQLAGGGRGGHFILTTRKNRNDNITPVITLDYDHEFYTLKAIEDPNELDTTSKILEGLSRLKKSGQNITTFSQVLSTVSVSTASLRRFARDTLAQEFVTFDRISGNKTMWRLK